MKVNFDEGGALYTNQSALEMTGGLHQQERSTEKKSSRGRSTEKERKTEKERTIEKEIAEKER